MYLINKLVSLKSSSFKSQSNGQDLKRGGRKRVGVASAKSCLPRSAFGGDLATEDEVSSIASSSLKSFSISSSVGSVRSDRSSVPSSVVSVDVNRNEVVPPSAQQQAVGRGSGSVKSSKSWLKPSRKRNTSDSGSVLSTESDQSAVSTASSQLAEQQLDHLSNKIDKLLVCLDKSNQSHAAVDGQQPIAGSRDEECVICVTFKASIHCHPCGHRVVCKKCFVKTIQMAVAERKLPLRCVVCRAKILRITNTTSGGLNMGHVMREQRRHLGGNYPTSNQRRSASVTSSSSRNSRSAWWNPIWTSPATSPVSPVTELFRDQRTVFFRLPEKFYDEDHDSSPTSESGTSEDGDEEETLKGKLNDQEEVDCCDSGSVTSTGSGGSGSSSGSKSGSCRFHRHKKGEICSHTGLPPPSKETVKTDSQYGPKEGCCELSRDDRKLDSGRIKVGPSSRARPPGTRRSSRHRKHIQAAMLAAARTSAIALGPIQESDQDEDTEDTE